MTSEQVTIKEAEFAGFKVLLKGVSVAQLPSLELALQAAKNLDQKASAFALTSKDQSKKLIKI